MVDTMAGKVALVTGGSQGIGLATSAAFAASGAQVVIASRGQEKGEAAAADIQSGGGSAVWICADVTQEDEVSALIAQVTGRFGRLDYAFNNAGSGGQGGWLHEVAGEDFEKTVSGFLKSVYLCMKYEIQFMLEHGGGAIVNNSSVDGQRAFPWDPIYSAAKHGVLGLTKSAALQYIQRGIRINAVCPGWIDTPAIEGMKQDPEAVRGAMLHQPIGRFGKAEEVGQAVVWLCSEQSSLVVGTALAVDGGYLAV